MKTVTFIVDTDSYSGNFERQLCAYMTGHVGETRGGSEQAKQYRESYEPMGNVIYVPDDTFLTPAPVHIEITPGYWNNGLGFNFKEGEEELALQKFKEYIRKDDSYFTFIQSLQQYYGVNDDVFTDEKIDKLIEKKTKEREKALNKTEVEKYPAYQSIAIRFSSLNDDEIEFLKNRAIEYSKISPHEFNIIGFKIKEEDENEI